MFRAPLRRFAESSLRGRLIILVLIPVLGMTVFTVITAKNRLHSVNTAAAGRLLVGDAAALDHVRVGLEEEIIPSQGLSVLSSPRTRKQLGLDQTGDNVVEMTRKNVATLRHKTDVALDAALARPSLRSEPSLRRDKIAASRKGLSVATTYDTNLTAAQKIVTEIAELETDKVNQAMQLGLDGATVRALQDLSMVMQVGQNASQQSGTYVAITLIPDPKRYSISLSQAYKSWGAYQAAGSQIEASGTPALRAEWERVKNSEDVAPFDRLVASSLSHKPATGKARFADALGVFSGDGPRNAAFSNLLQFATDRATASVARSEAKNRRELWINVALSLVVDLAVVALVLFINRSMTRPLSLVAVQARRLSEGDLTTIPVGGPREVRTVARGLQAAVASLQRIQDSAKAVAENDLENKAIQEPLPGRLGEVIHASMGRIVDAIAEQEKAQRALAHRAAYDALTELPNRAQALANLEQALQRASRAGWVTALLFIDLDRFKLVNDTLGHQAGDEVLKIAAERMLETVRAGDMVARLGGDEFVVLVENVETETDLVQLAERLVDRLSEPMTVLDHSVTIGASVGVALAQDGHVEAGALLREADAAVYEAKRGGRGRVDVFDDRLRGALSERAELEDAMRTALANDEFELYYQPVVELETGLTRSMEALIRWNRPGHGTVPPDRFIPTAELSSLINDIGRWTLRHAAVQIRDWVRSDPAGGLAVAVNISGRHLSSAELVDDVRSALFSAGIGPDRLILEITETVVLDDPRALTNMTELRELGVKLAIDDFGTGYTSIGQLARLPVDIVKIDRSFTSSTDETHRSLVALMVTAAHTFGMEVVAEGIETAAQARELRAALADTGQGYYFARPAPAEPQVRAARFSLEETDRLR